MEWEPTNEEDERADAARQIEPDADGPAKLQTPLTPQSWHPSRTPSWNSRPMEPPDRALGTWANRPVHLRRKRSPQKTNSTTSNREPIEEDPEDVEWELIEDEPDDVEWDPVEDEDDGT